MPRPTKRRAKKRKPQASPPVFLRLVADAGVFALTLLIALAVVVAYYARDLPDTKALWRNEQAPRMSLLARDGSPITVQGASKSAPVRMAALPDHVTDAILAVEDRNFYHHIGVNPVSVARAFFVNVKQGEVRQGGSTITQQLAKNVFLNADRTIKRKVQELLLALWLEQGFTKDEILTLYINRVYFGAGAYGIDAASYRYFGKSATYLSVGEAAVLAGLLKAPSRLAPTNHPEDAGRRARLVLDQMVEAGFLSARDADEAIGQPIRLHRPRRAGAPYLVDYALKEARRLSAGFDADLIIQTTFDPAMQSAAQTGLIAAMAGQPGGLQGVQAAIVLLDGEGAVRAMIGGRDYRHSQFNRAVQARRQPGSAFKPFVYLAALQSGLHADDIVLDAPLTVGKWSPDNYRSKYYGEVTMREALARSLNGAAIRVQEAVGRQTVRDSARAMGFERPLAKGPSLALGVDEVSPLELAGAYAAFANGGLRVRPHVIDWIKTADGQEIYRRQGSIVDRAASPAVIEEMNDMLRSVTQWGSGRAAALGGYRAAGKTGTSQNSRDAWFAGHAGGLTGVVWLGHDDNSPMRDGAEQSVTGGGAPAQIWRETMARALYSRRPQDAPLIGNLAPAQ